MEPVKLVYFAWLRERIGQGAEDTVLPPELVTVADVVAWLSERGEGYAWAFQNPAVVRVAIDRRHVRPDEPIAGAREIAFFPPMTGG